MRCARVLGVLLISVVGPASLLRAQQPPASSTSLPGYRPPALALVQPAAGGSLPSDKPVLVFRFAPGEPTDPIDALSFAVSVDGIDRTSRFQVTAAEAWGTVADVDAGEMSARALQVSARICSTRGACAEVSATVPVFEPAHANPAPGEGTSSARRRKVIDAVIEAIRKLLDR